MRDFEKYAESHVPHLNSGLCMKCMLSVNVKVFVRATLLITILPHFLNPIVNFMVLVASIMAVKMLTVKNIVDFWKTVSIFIIIIIIIIIIMVVPSMNFCWFKLIFKSICGTSPVKFFWKYFQFPWPSFRLMELFWNVDCRALAYSRKPKH